MPAVFVKQHDLIGRQRKIIGQVGVGHPVLGHGEAAAVMGAHVHAEEVPGCRGPEGAIGSLTLRIEARGLVIVSVDGVGQ